MVALEDRARPQAALLPAADLCRRLRAVHQAVVQETPVCFCRRTHVSRPLADRAAEVSQHLAPAAMAAWGLMVPAAVAAEAQALVPLLAVLAVAAVTDSA